MTENTPYDAQEITTIRLSRQTHDALCDVGHMGETYETIIIRLIKNITKDKDKALQDIQERRNRVSHE